jgi:membrane-associated phospholipid phosphatase
MVWMLASMTAGTVCKAQSTTAAKEDQAQAEDWEWNVRESRTKPVAIRVGRRRLSFLERFTDDQRGIWSSPWRVRQEDAMWLVPLGGLTAGLLASDRNMSASFSNAPGALRHYRTISDAGVLALAGIVGGVSLWGAHTQDSRAKETGFLAGEAVANSLLVAEVFKLGAGRERPLQGNSGGNFGAGGNSFPSEHAAAAWAAAGILLHEYPGPFTKVLAYGLAAAVSVSRVRAKEHFPSDVVVGGAMGWLVS